ncbi:MAG: prolyl oligopeptidase family serine peptidase [bacterium]|nr:prolyl oligopeptidase family serine peptidase [bacterium]
MPQQDPFLWLEDVDSDRALSWVRERNAATTAELTETEFFTDLQRRVLAILDSDDRVPWVNRRNEHYYNLWQDAKNPRGLWRRTSLAEYRKDTPQWDVLLDLDELGRQEDENWVWKGATFLMPERRFCLVSLSRGGADAVVVREFDVEERKFVTDGFTLPESKTMVSWIDRDHIFVGTNFGEGSLTSSGYPRVAKRWRRGTPLTAAEVVGEGEAGDVWFMATHDQTIGFERDLLARGTTFFTNEMFVMHDGERIKLDKPDSATAGLHREWLFVSLRENWSVGGKDHPAGALLAIRLTAFLAGERNFDVLFTPTPRTSLAGYSPTLNHVLLNELDNVKNRIYVLTPGSDDWQRELLPGLPEFGTVNASAADSDFSDDYFLTITDYLTPTSLWLGTIGKAPAARLKSQPSFFDTKGLAVQQLEATSKDGTKIPYFLVKREDTPLDGSNPTLLYGYGGFEVSMTPSYGAVTGTAWLERGGVFAVANIRGGGEFGPQWHQAALKEKRHKAYEDFAAVAEDLIARKITAPKHLGIQGGSNGGLLVGNMLTMYPELFGAVVCQVPLLDMLRYHKLLAGASWIGEYGNPDVPEEAEFLLRYSPYHTVKADRKYPRVLFTTSTRDDRVHPGHARKMMARMMEQGHAALYYENIEGGHGGAADNKQAAFMTSLAYTFLWRTLK